MSWKSCVKARRLSMRWIPWVGKSLWSQSDSLFSFTLEAVLSYRLSSTMLVALIFLYVGPIAYAQRVVDQGLVIKDVTLISPERAAPLQHAYVRIRDGRIAEVSERPLRGEQQIDGAGRYLTPGLIDSHVHLAVSPGFPAAMTAEQAAAHPDVVAATRAQDPKSYLFFGFTTVVDLI